MRVLKWIFLGGVFLLLSLVGLLFFANWYVGVHGLPASLEDKIRAEAEKQGVGLEFTNARLINLERLELLQVTVSDSAGWEVLQAERITVWLTDVLEAPRATGAEIAGLVRLPLSVNDGLRSVLLKGLHLHVQLSPDRLELASFHAQVGCVELRVSGGLDREEKVKKPASSDAAKPAGPSTPKKPRRIDLAALSSSLSPEIRRAISETLDICEARNGRGKLELRVDGSLANLAACTVDVDAHLAGLLARGISIDTFAANGRYHENRLNLPQLYLGFDGDESLRGSASYVDGKLAADLALRVYPEKVTRVLELKVPEIFPRFGVPIDAQLHLPATALGDIRNCHATASFEAHDIGILDATIRDVSADLEYREGELFFRNMNAVLDPEVIISTDGSFHIDRMRIALRANILGHPGFVSAFSKHQRFKDMWSKTWKRFRFSPERPPRFVGTLQWQRGWPDVITTLRGEWANVSYNGVTFDRATAEAVYDGSDKLLLLRNLDLHRQGRWLRGDIAWLFSSRRLDRKGRLHFEAASTLGSAELFDLIGLRWGQRQTAAGVSTPLGYTAAAGDVHFYEHDKTNLRLYSSMPTANYRRSQILDGQLELDLDGPKIALSGHIGSLKNGDWTLSETDFDFDHGPDTHSLSGKVTKVQAGIGLMLRNSQFDTVFKDEKVASLTGTCAEVDFQEAHCAGVSGKVDLLGEQGYVITAKAEQGKIREFEGQSLTARMDIVDGRTRAEFASAKLELPKVAELRNVNGKVVLQEAQTTFRLSASSSKHLGSDARTEMLTIRGTSNDGELDLHFQTPKLYALKNGVLDEVKLRVFGDGGRLSHELEVGALVLGENLRARRLRGKGPWLRQSFNTHFEATELFAMDVPFTAAAGTVSWTQGHLSLSHLEGDLFGGKAKGSAFYSNADEAGSTWWTLENLSLSEASTHFGKPPSDADEPDAAKPTIDGNVNLSMTGWGDSLSLHGNGHLGIKDGNFVHYRVPIVSDFLQLVTKTPIGLLNQLNPLKDIGKITRLRTDLIFEDDRILIPNLRSNGGVIAISADGHYRWKDPWIEIRLRAGSLPKIWKHIPLVSDPFEVLLERKAVGPPTDYKWQPISGITELFQFNKDKDEDRKK
jgi:hypothetical protein